MSPTIGRIVLWSDVSQKEHPAIITAVHSLECVNLHVFFDFGATMGQFSVLQRTTDELSGRWR